MVSVCRPTLAALIVLCVSATAMAQPEEELPSDPRAASYLKRAQRLFEERDFDGAAVELEAGYAIEPKRVFLFSLATVERRRGHCKRAVMLYRCFIATDPPEKQRTAAEAGLSQCGQAYEELPKATCESLRPNLSDNSATSSPEEKTKTTESKPTKQADSDNALRVTQRAHDSRRWYLDPVGDALVGVGLVGLAVGGTYTWLGNRDATSANDAGDVVRWRQLKDRADDRRLIGGIALAAGGTMALAGIIRWLVVGNDSGAPAMTATATSDSLSFGIAGEF